MPEEITHSCHRHPLTKVKDAYGDLGFGCDVCSGSGKGWAYRCGACGFDAHVHCVYDISKLGEEPRSEAAPISTAGATASASASASSAPTPTPSPSADSSKPKAVVRLCL